MTKIFLLNIGEILKNPVDELLKKYFTPKRQREILRYKFNSDRNRTIFAELLARKIIFEITGRKIFIHRDEKGKPFCDISGIYFSLSHSGKWAACSVGDEPNGVDIENFSRKINLAVAKRFFLPEEYHAIKFLHDNNKNWQKKFFEYWTIKESALKCFGLNEWTGVNCEKLLKEKRARNFYINDDYIAGVCVSSGCVPEKINFLSLSELNENYPCA